MYELKLTITESSPEDIETDLKHFAEQIRQRIQEEPDKDVHKGYGWEVITYEEVE